MAQYDVAVTKPIGSARSLSGTEQGSPSAPLAQERVDGGSLYFVTPLTSTA